jgi:hypothetical protein
VSLAQSAMFEVVGAGKSSETFTAMVASAAFPCSAGAQQLLSDALAASVVSSGDHCTVTLATGEVLTVSSPVGCHCRVLTRMTVEC